MATYSPQQLKDFMASTAGGRTNITPAEMDASGWGADPRAMYAQATGGGGTTGGATDPAGLAALFQPPAVTLPGAEAAKTGLRDLQTQSVGGLSKLMGSDPYAERQKLTDALYGNAASDINYSSDRLARDAKESQGAKNMLNSSATGDYFLDPIERNRSVGLEKAANDAYVSANNMLNQNQTTQAQILGQGFNEGTTGLQGEANVENANAGRVQQGNEAGYQTGLQLSENAANRAQQQGQFTSALGQQKDLTEQGFQNTKDIANAQGVGAGLGGLAQLFAPNIRSAASNLGFG